MAKESIKARERKRERLVAKYAKKREELRAADDFVALDKLPRNSSSVRLKGRCSLTGRPKGFIRYYGLSRNKFRELAVFGKIPGVTKASW